MRKIIVALGLILMCVAYFVHIRTGVVKMDSKNKVDVLINNEKDQLAQVYPDSPKGVIESHNRLMKYEYSKEIRDEDIGLLIETMRMLYSAELLKHNSLEKQEASLSVEIAKNKEKGLYIIDSEIGDILYKGVEKAIVIVKHFTTMGDITRDYHLTQENSEWKIESWENRATDEKIE